MNARLLIAIGIAALGRPESAGGQTYAVSNLGMLDAQRSRGSAAYDMNNLGQLAGSSSIYADGDWTIGAQWSHGRWSFLPEPADSMYIKAWAINDAGQVACSSIISVEESYPVCWSNGVYIELGTLGGATAVPWDINSLGHIVGFSELDDDPLPVTHGFLWNNESMMDLPPLGGSQVPYSVALGINDVDVAVGTSQLAISAQYRATVWDHGAIIDLGTLPGRLSSSAEAINNAGQIVGYCSFDHAGDSDQEAVLWQDGQIIELGPLEPPDPQSGHRWMTLPYDINDYGEIVCIGQTGWDSTECYIWHDGVITRFREFLPEDFDWTLGPAAINNAGQIACTGRHPDVQYPRAFILTPPVCRGFPRGDANCDGLVNNFDIDAFVLALSNVDRYAIDYAACNWLCNLDINRDGAVNNFDIDPFVTCVANGGCP